MSPCEAARSIEAAAVVPAGRDERFGGYGVMGLPFESGHYLGLRRFAASSIGPAYTAVWWRDPAGAWVIFATAGPSQSCARYFSRALSRGVTTPIDLTWGGPRSLQVRIPDQLDWHIELGTSPASSAMSALGGITPGWAWRQPLALDGMAAVAGPLLAGGRLRLHGQVPNGQSFRVSPRQVWTVRDSRARIDGQDLGRPGPLGQQPHLADVWLPQRGVFFVGEAHFQPPDTPQPPASENT